jgi:Cu/Ag efflux pump CusA
MIRKTKFKNITIINNLIIPQDIAKLRTYIDCSPLQKEENNPNTFINVQDSECNSILSKAQQLLKSNIAFNSSKSFFTTRSSIDSHILSTTSIEFLK